MKEIWKDVPSYEGYYKISNFGRVKSLERISIRNNGYSDSAKYLIKEKIKKPQKQQQGYMHVCLYRNGKSKTFRLNVLVAKLFVPNPDCKPFVNHIDGNKENNAASNLEWVTASENILHAYKNNLLHHFEKPVIQVSKSGEFLREFGSVKEAAEFVKGSKGNICSVCNGKRKSANGFLWKYKE